MPLVNHEEQKIATNAPSFRPISKSARHNSMPLFDKPGSMTKVASLKRPFGEVTEAEDYASLRRDIVKRPLWQAGTKVPRPGISRTQVPDVQSDSLVAHRDKPNSNGEAIVREMKSVERSLDQKLRQTEAVSALNSASPMYQSPNAHLPGRSHECNECGETFTRETALRIHQDLHFRGRSHKCSACGKAFKRVDDLIRHRDTHTGGFHTCNRCGMAFLRENVLRRHQRTQHGERQQDTEDLHRDQNTYDGGRRQDTHEAGHVQHGHLNQLASTPRSGPHLYMRYTISQDTTCEPQGHCGPKLSTVLGRTRFPPSLNSMKGLEKHSLRNASGEVHRPHEKQEEGVISVEGDKIKMKPLVPKQIHFKDAFGRKFAFPWHLCKTWKGMEELIKQAFLDNELSIAVHSGHYDLIGPHAVTIVPDDWETTVQPDWTISMQMWSDVKAIVEASTATPKEV